MVSDSDPWQGDDRNFRSLRHCSDINRDIDWDFMCEKWTLWLRVCSSKYISHDVWNVLMFGKNCHELENGLVAEHQVFSIATDDLAQPIDFRANPTISWTHRHSGSLSSSQPSVFRRIMFKKCWSFPLFPDNVTKHSIADCQCLESFSRATMKRYFRLEMRLS